MNKLQGFQNLSKAELDNDAKLYWLGFETDILEKIYNSIRNNEKFCDIDVYYKNEHILNNVIKQLKKLGFYPKKQKFIDELSLESRLGIRVYFKPFILTRIINFLKG